MPHRLQAYKTILLSAFMLGWSHTIQASTEHELQFFHRYSTLDSPRSDWSDWRLYWYKQQDADNALYLELNDIYHFGIRDQQLAWGNRINSSSTLQYQTELTTSTAHSLYPLFSLYGGIETKLNKSLVLNTGLRFSHFNKSNSTASSLLFTSRFDYYTGNQLYSYSLYFTNMQGLALSDNVITHSIKYAYIYSEKNNIYLSYAQGDEIDFDPDNAALISSATQSINLGGLHWLNQTLAIVYTIAKHNVAPTTNSGYQRNELYIGLRKLY